MICTKTIAPSVALVSCCMTANPQALGVLGCAGSMTRQLPTRQADACRRAAMVQRIYQDKLPRMQVGVRHGGLL